MKLIKFSIFMFMLALTNICLANPPTMDTTDKELKESTTNITEISDLEISNMYYDGSVIYLADNELTLNPVAIADVSRQRKTELYTYTPFKSTGSYQFPPGYLYLKTIWVNKKEKIGIYKAGWLVAYFELEPFTKCKMFVDKAKYRSEVYNLRL